MQGSIPTYSDLYLLEEYTLPAERGIRYKVQGTVKALPVHTLKSYMAVKVQFHSLLFLTLDRVNGQFHTLAA